LGRLNLLKEHLNASDPERSLLSAPITLSNGFLPNKVVLETNENNIWTGFYKKPVFERISQISKIFNDLDLEKLKSGGLNLLRADSMIENCIGIINLPVGLG